MHKMLYVSWNSLLNVHFINLQYPMCNISSVVLIVLLIGAICIQRTQGKHFGLSCHPSTFSTVVLLAAGKFCWCLVACGL